MIRRKRQEAGGGTSIGLSVVDVDLVELNGVLAGVGSDVLIPLAVGENAVFGADGLPEFGADLITALTHLNVHDFSHLVLALNARSIRSFGCCYEDAHAAGFLTPPLAPPERSAAAADWPAWRPALKLRVRNSTNSHFGGNALAPKAPSHLSLSSNILLVA